MKRNLFFFSVLILFCTPSLLPQGNLLIIGGGRRTDAMMHKFVELAGGTYSSRILIIPNASGDPNLAGGAMVEELDDMGCRNLEYVVLTPALCNSDSLISALQNITGVFFTGGDQSRLTSLMLNTKILNLIKDIYNKGGVISGTSAGAAIMSEVMLTGDEKRNTDSSSAFISVMKDNVVTVQGFGFVKNAIIDQHFIIRKRFNRLLSVVLEHPKLIGIGIDESTAILYKPDKTFEVIGERNVLVIDATKSTGISLNKIDLFAADNITLHLLKAGQIFDSVNRKLIK